MRRHTIAPLLVTLTVAGCGGGTEREPGPDLPAEAGSARSFALETVADGFEQPVQAVAHPTTGVLHIVEQGGLVKTVDGETVLDVSARTSASGEQGLLSLAFAPDGKRSYLLYTDKDGNTKVEEQPGGKEILTVEQPFPNHNGGTLLFDERGRLVLGLGDGGGAFDPDQRSQDLDQKLGKLLRYEDGRWTTVALGLRNPWRMAFDRETGRLWVGDVGQDKIEEIDAFFPAEEGQRPPNLGWDAYEGPNPMDGGADPQEGLLTWPVAGYTHDDGHCSVTGGEVYRGTKVAALRGRYVYGDFCRGTIWSLDADGATAAQPRPDVRREAARVPGLVSFGVDEDGELLAISLQGTVSRLISDPNG